MGWWSYWATTGNWHQISSWFEGSFNGFRVQIEILAAVFYLILKQQLNLWLFLSDLNYKKLGLTDLPGHHGKVTSDKKIIFISHQRNKCVNEDYCSHCSVTFETSNFLIVFVRMILEKVVWQSYQTMTGNWHQISIWFGGNFKGFKVQTDFCSRIFAAKQQLTLSLLKQTHVFSWAKITKYCGSMVKPY